MRLDQTIHFRGSFQEMTKRVTVTGAAGQIAYSLLFRIARGELFGQEKVRLHLLDIPPAEGALLGVKMELDDCAFPLLEEVVYGCDPYTMFEGIDAAFLVGAKPRGPGMERSDLLLENAKIFVEQGKALNQSANPNAKVLVVGNPCNTNCLIALSNAPNLSSNNFHAMTRLDQNRAASLLAQKSNRAVTDIDHMTIWGNHSATQVPDFFNAKISSKKAVDVIQDQKWLENDFISQVQTRGAKIIEARGKSSAASAASSALDAMRDLITPTKEGMWFSSGVLSNKNPYGIEEGIVFSFPCRVDQEGVCHIVEGVEWSSFVEEKIKITEKELIDERSSIENLCHA